MMDRALSHTLTSPSDDYYPQRNDSHREIARPENSFLESFKQSLIYSGAYCTDPACCTFFDTGIPSNPLAEVRSKSYEEDSKAADLAYPLALFERLEGLPPLAELRDLASHFHRAFRPSVPFLAKVSCLQSGDVPVYLLLSTALLGAAVSLGAQGRPTTKVIWQACINLATGTVEVDNSLGRAIPWLTAASLLVAFGSTQSDLSSWRQTDVVNGYLQATLFRSEFLHKSISGLSHTVVEADISALRSFYFIIDTLRSIHFHTPSTVEPAWSVRLGHEMEYDFRSLYGALILDKGTLPTTLSTDDYVLFLVNILSDISTLSFSVGPLTSVSFSIREQATIRFRGESRTRPTGNDSSKDSDFSPQSGINPLLRDVNQHVPFTADHEWNRMRKALVRSLQVWNTSFSSRICATNPATTIPAATVLPLFHWCRLLLELGPSFYLLPALAGYTSSDDDHPPLQLCEPYQIGMECGDHAVRIAVEILESVQVSLASPTDTTADHLGCRTPIWYPLVLFYGALVVWGRSREDEEAGRQSHILLPSRMVLHMFLTELKKTDWECSDKMAEVISSLIS